MILTPSLIGNLATDFTDCTDNSETKGLIGGNPRKSVAKNLSGLQHSDLELRHDGIRDGIDHLRARLDDAAPFGIAPHHESVNIMKKDQRDQVLVAIHDEARGLFGGLGVDHATKFHPLVSLVIGLLRVQLLIGHNTYRKSADASVTAEHRLSVFGLVLVEAAAV